MAQTTLNISVSLPLFFLITILVSLEAKVIKMKETNMVFYMQDWETGSNVTAISVAGLNGTNSSPLNFGTIAVLDDPITIGVDRYSKQIGRARGIFSASALDGSTIHRIFSFVFTDGEYKGSTLQIQGLEVYRTKRRELSVVSGTGLFRYARGYIVFESAFMDIPNLNAVLKVTVTVRHY
ncbi:dirigent protein 2-like [Magnolia sinica]|uniref:dirigent protein 2-like n=1 Tax=Magnolia sinica TaxID=86752 RepID=UPI00265A18E8|nr:dirigent protein 2-like [Magnolia sinica]